MHQTNMHGVVRCFIVVCVCLMARQHMQVAFEQLINRLCTVSFFAATMLLAVTASAIVALAMPQ